MGEFLSGELGTAARKRAGHIVRQLYRLPATGGKRCCAQPAQARKKIFISIY
jgi:hypothetical protein